MLCLFPPNNIETKFGTRKPVRNYPIQPPVQWKNSYSFPNRRSPPLHWHKAHFLQRQQQDCWTAPTWAGSFMLESQPLTMPFPSPLGQLSWHLKSGTTFLPFSFLPENILQSFNCRDTLCGSLNMLLPWQYSKWSMSFLKWTGRIQCCIAECSGPEVAWPSQRIVGRFLPIHF